MTQIKDALLDSNPWWKGEFVPEYREREIYRQIEKYLPMPQIIALVGLRRVGKTTLMLKIASDYIKSGMDPKNILYFSFDEFQEANLGGIIREYELLLEKDIRSGRFLLLLDEIQKLENWEEQIKRLYDTYGKNIKLVISGSESLFIRKKSKETLAGRIFEFRVDTLSFKEFLGFKQIAFRPAGLYEKELQARFGEYALTCGFPELIGVNDREIILKYIKESIIEKVIYRDIPRLFVVRDTAILELLLRIISDEPGQIIELSGLAKELGASRQTVSRYLGYLEKSFIIRKLYNFSKSMRKTERKLKKYYPSVLSGLLFRDDGLSRSKALEWLVATKLNAEFFWRDPYKNEVDIVIDGKSPVPIEVKYGKIDTGGLLAFMGKFNARRGYIISYGREEEIKAEGRTIIVVPAFKFLLEPGKYLK